MYYFTNMKGLGGGWAERDGEGESLHLTSFHPPIHSFNLTLSR